MIIQIDKFDIIWTYLSKFLRIGQGLILLPLILRFLPTDQISIWALFSTITALISVFDLGFSNVFSRNLTQILSGKKVKLLDEGSSDDRNEDTLDLYSLKKLIIIMKKFYGYISLLLLLLLVTIGTYYIYYIGKDVENKTQLYFSWAFLIGSSILNFFYNYLTIILESKGLIKETQKISVYGIMLSMVFAIVGIFMGYGLIAITFSGFISVLFNRFFLYRLYSKEIRPMIPNKIFAFDVSYFKEIWSVTYKVSIASISSIAIYRSGIIIISLFLPLKEAGIFAFSMNLAFILSEVSFMYFYTHLPQVNSMVFHHDNSGLKKIFLSSIIMSFFSLFLGGFVLVFLGDYILHFIGSKMTLIPAIPFSFVILILLLDQIQNMSTFILFSENKLNYMWPYAISATIIILSTLILCKLMPIYLSVILPQFLIQLSFNYWFWPKQIFDKLEVKITDFKNCIPFNISKQ
ncbi:O-unit flippase-like protein [Flavobacterium artemisiae]|uniref:O-unit flippase-like protein n=1 Tax=Flavobacterium artemisiae TaxID=2126556 RepID=A0ABW4H8U2_9FLAO